jgi:hypothetical protein
MQPPPPPRRFKDDGESSDDNDGEFADFEYMYNKPRYEWLVFYLKCTSFVWGSRLGADRTHIVFSGGALHMG